MLRSFQRSGVADQALIQSRTRGPGRAPPATATEASSVSSSGERRRWFHGEVDHAVAHLEPTARGLDVGGLGPRRPRRPQPAEPPPQQGWCHQGGHQHHEQERGVQVCAEDPRVQADRGEDQADLAAGIMPRPMSHLSPGEPNAPTAATQLAHTATAIRPRRDPAAPRG